MAPRLTRRRWRFSLWDGGGAPLHTLPSHACPPPAEGRQRKALWFQPLPQLSRFKKKKKINNKTENTKLYGADVRCAPGKCQALCAVAAHVLPAVHAVLASSGGG